MAEVVGCSRDTIQSIELGRLPLSEELARRISAATGVHFRWLIENDLRAKIANRNGAPYTQFDYDLVASRKNRGEYDTMLESMSEDYAASFYGQIRAILSSAVKGELGEVAVWKIATFLEECRNRFGHDKKLIAETEQFGLRDSGSFSGTPYLKVRQVEAAKALFRAYDREREELIQGTEVPKSPRKKRARRQALSAGNTLT